MTENLDGWTEAYHRGCRAGMTARKFVAAAGDTAAEVAAAAAGYVVGTGRHTVFVTGFVRHMQAPEMARAA